MGIFASCQKSPEDKAKGLIRDYIIINANDPNSYEPIEFEALDSIKSWYHDDDEFKRLESLKSDNIILFDSIQPLLDSIKENFKPELKGYMMRHSFRAKNGFGALVINKKVFRFDLGINEVVSSDDTLD